MPSFQGLGDLPGGRFRTFAKGLTPDGSVVVGESEGDSGYEAFRWENGLMTGLGELPGGSFFSEAHAVSADGSVIAGWGNSTSGFESFRWENDLMVGLGDLPGGSFSSYATAVAANGSVVVGKGNSSSGDQACRWDNDLVIGLGDLPGGIFESYATDLSADGAIVVGFGASDLGDEAFIWDASHNMGNLRDVLVSDLDLDLTGWTLTKAWGISDNGRIIIGDGINPHGNYEGWIATVPEPTTLPLLALAAVGALRRRPPASARPPHHHLESAWRPALGALLAHRLQIVGRVGVIRPQT